MAMKPVTTLKSRLLATALAPVLGLSAFIAAPGVAAAQEAAAPEAGVEVVVVTARKREESSQDVPGSLTAIRGDALTTLTSGGVDIGSAMSARVPSVVVESSFGRTFPRFYIRGLGNTDFDLNASQPVSLIYDEVVQENPILKGFPVFDTQRIEVLRGPQGTLFGRNTPAGIVKFESVRPDDAFGGYARAGIRSFEGRDLEGAVNLPVSDTLALRASGLLQTQDDWVRNTVPTPEAIEFGGFSDFAWRVQGLWTPNDAFSALLNIHGRDFEGTSQLFRANAMTRGRRGLNASFVRDRVTYDGGGGNNQELTSLGGVLRLDYDFGAMTLTSVTGYESVEFLGRGDIDGGSLANGPGVIPFPADTADGIPDHKQITQEVRLSSNGSGPVSWQGGLYLFEEDLTVDTFLGGTTFAAAQQTQDTSSWALFGSATWQVGDRLSVTGGARYSSDEKTITARGGLANFPLTRVNRSDDGFTFDLSAVYELSETTNLYGRLAQGFRAPSFQGRVLFPPPQITSADSETLTSLEGGVKFVSTDRTLRADVSVYAYQIEDMQITAVGGQTNNNRLLNADKGLGNGVEVEVQWLPLSWLALNGSVSYNKTEFDDPTLRSPGCGLPGGCTVLDPVAPGGFSINGNSFPNAPELMANFSAKYTRTIGDGEFYMLTDWSYKGETNFFLYESVEFSEDGFWEGGIRVGYEVGNLEFAAYGRNILDEERLVGGIDFNNLTGFVNQPRVIGAEVKVKF